MIESPFLYHMAMEESWPLIRENGLLPTDLLLDLFEVEHDLKAALLNERRPRSVEIKHARLGKAIVSDQFPMDERGLLRCLQGGLTPLDWYKILKTARFLLAYRREA
jgi:hypothetical protein